MEKKNLLVQLFVPTAGMLGRIGTAYPVAVNVLLTAAHVIGDADGRAVQARWWHQAVQDREWKNCTEILWDGRDQSPKIDVVLLRCEFPDAVRSLWGTVTAARPEDHAKWSSEGFPEVGDRHSKPVDMQGVTHSMGDQSEHFDLAVTAAADTDEGWRGASGSPVFVNERIIGVIVICPPHFRAERLQAVPLFRLLKDDKFRKLVGYIHEAPDDGSVLEPLRLLADDVRRMWIDSDATFHQAVELQAILEFSRTQDTHIVERQGPVSLLGPDPQLEFSVDHTLRDVFEQHSRSMLIAGPPGCGKTTALLYLAKSLMVDRSGQETELFSVPVILSLDSWNSKDSSFEAWCISELGKTYRIPSSLGRKWLDERRLCLLLDGLDELSSPDRQRLVDELNSFQAKKGPPGIVVCSRLDEYMELSKPLRLNVAVILQPLAEQHICTYLSKLNRSDLSRQVLSDPRLRVLSTTPLMLRLLTLIPASDVDKATSQSQTDASANLADRLIDSFLTRMADSQQQRVGGVTPAAFTAALSWLAKSMMDHKRRILRIEAIQPGWAQNSLQTGVYVLLSRTLVGLTLSMLIGAIVSGSCYLQGGSATYSVFAMIWYLYVGGSGGLLLGAASSGKFIEPEKDTIIDGKRWIVSRVLVAGWLLFFVCFFLFPTIFSLTMIGGLLLGGVFAVSDGTLNPQHEREIQTVEALGWSWTSALRGIVVAVFPGWMVLNCILLLRVGGTATIDNVLGWAIDQLTLVGVASISGFLLGGLVRKKRPSKKDPNEGLLLSLQNMLRSGAIGCLAGAIVFLVLIPLGKHLTPEDPVADAKHAITDSQTLFAQLREMLDKTVPLDPQKKNLDEAKEHLGKLEQAVRQKQEEELRSAVESRNQSIGVVMPPRALPGSIRSEAIEICTWGLITGIVLSFIYGGIALVRHFTLRCILCVSPGLPFRLSRLLCNAADVAVMRRVGSGFMFTHIEIQRRVAAKTRS